MVNRGRQLKADRWSLVGRSVLLRILLPDWIDIPGVVQGTAYGMITKYSDYQRLGKDGFVEVSMTSPNKCVVFIADPQAYKEVTRLRAHFVRDVEAMSLVGLFGNNLLTVEGDEWKHHRKIAQRAFTEKTPRLVWTETTAALEQLFELWDQDHGSEVYVPHVLDMTKTKYLRQSMDARRRGGDCSLSASKTEPHSARAANNVFDVLVAASDEDVVAEGRGLADDEVIGNAFLFLFAGHETTASAVAFALGLLALYPHIQQEVYAQITHVMISRSRLDYTDIGELDLVSGAFLETLRLFPSISELFRIAYEDTMLSVAKHGPGLDGTQRETIFVPAGSSLTCSVGVTAAYWPEPGEFRPSRFSGAYNRDAFLPFSAGGKACIGQKFAETEGIAALACILARYEVSIDTALFPDIPGESNQARQARLLEPKLYISAAPRKVPLVFTRRI
ncbi:hypothetical protein FRC07_003636 [Ceratobasidium sp. 392]|nr:hypothetical protein FRC07_003636 [Ceratobasidium sp. 392]